MTRKRLFKLGREKEPHVSLKTEDYNRLMSQYQNVNRMLNKTINLKNRYYYDRKRYRETLEQALQMIESDFMTAENKGLASMIRETLGGDYVE